MSLFGSLMGDFEDDPFFGSHMQRMNNMMNSMFADPFGLMGPPAIMNAVHSQNRMGQQLMPFEYPPIQPLFMGRLFRNMDNMSQNPNCHSFSSSSVMTMTSGPDGRPQIYQESRSTMTGPGGVKETKQTVSDSYSGTKKMAIGHHIGDRAHILEREQNLNNGDQEERQEFINLDEEEADSFNKEWESRIKRSVGAIGAPHRSYNTYRGHDNRQLALPSTVPPSSRQSRNHSRTLAAPRRAIRSALSSRPSNTTTSRSAESTSTSTSTTTSSNSSNTANASPQNLTTTGRRNTNSRKREHSPDIEEITNECGSSNGNSNSNKRRSTESGAADKNDKDD